MLFDDSFEHEVRNSFICLSFCLSHLIFLFQHCCVCSLIFQVVNDTASHRIILLIRFWHPQLINENERSAALAQVLPPLLYVFNCAVPVLKIIHHHYTVHQVPSLILHISPQVIEERGHAYRDRWIPPISHANGGVPLESLLERVLLPPEDDGGLKCAQCDSPNCGDVHAVGKQLAVRCANCKVPILVLEGPNS